MNLEDYLFKTNRHRCRPTYKNPKAKLTIHKSKREKSTRIPGKKIIKQARGLKERERTIETTRKQTIK